MDEVINTLGWKKLTIILIGVFVLGLIVVIMSFMNTGKMPAVSNLISPTGVPANSQTGSQTGSSSNSQSDSTTNNTNTSDNKITQAPQQTKVVSLPKTYITKYYQISYPENFLSTPFKSDDTLDMLVLNDKNSSVKVEIVTYDITKYSLEQLASNFRALKYSENEISVNGFHGLQFNGKITGTSLNERIVLLEKNNAVIKMQFMNSTGPFNPDMQDAINSIVNSLQ